MERNRGEGEGVQVDVFARSAAARCFLRFAGPKRWWPSPEKTRESKSECLPISIVTDRLTVDVGRKAQSLDGEEEK